MKFYFEEAELWKERKQAVVRRINQLGCPLVLFGRSDISNPAILDEITVPVQFICSTHSTSWGKFLWGLEVVSLERIQAEYQRYTVLILPIDHKHEFVKMFQQLPLPPVEIFQLDLHFDDEDAASYFESHKAIVEENYKNWADQTSKDVYETMIRYRINRDPALLPTVTLPIEQQYFEKSLGGRPFLGSQEIYVDAGAFTGDTVNEFVRAVQGEYQHIYAFEPIPAHYEKLLKNTENFANISCIHAGIGNESKKVTFASNGQSSRPDESGQEIVQIDTLDNFLQNVKVTFIKMDVEGMEEAALLGAKDLIAANHPKLAICLDHSNKDIVLLPQLIRQLNPSYQLYCRQYGPSVCDMVCYAV